MVPIEKIKDIVTKHDALEKELSTGSVDPKLFANKSKEYSNLGHVISIAREYIGFENEKKDLEQILQDKSNDSEMIEMVEKDFHETKKNMLIQDIKY